MFRHLLLAVLPFLAAPATAQTPPPHPILLRPDRVFDGVAMHPGWSVLVEGERIVAAGPAVVAPAGTETVALPGTTPCSTASFNPWSASPAPSVPRSRTVVNPAISVARAAATARAVRRDSGSLST